MQHNMNERVDGIQMDEWMFFSKCERKEEKEKREKLNCFRLEIMGNNFDLWNDYK